MIGWCYARRANYTLAHGGFSSGGANPKTKPARRDIRLILSGFYERWFFMRGPRAGFVCVFLSTQRNNRQQSK
jgi:hypothetical protein